MSLKSFGIDLDRWGWPAIAIVFSGVDVVLFLASRVVDLLWFPGTSFGFLVATLAFLAIVWLDGRGVGVPRPWLWAIVATFVPLIGTIPYARRRALRTAHPGDFRRKSFRRA